MQPHIETVGSIDIITPDKVDLALLLLGEKYATEIVLDSDEHPDDTPVKRVDRGAVDVIRRQLDTLPVTHRVRPEQLVVTLARQKDPTEAHLVDDGRTRVMIEIANNEDDLSTFHNALCTGDDITLGRLYGFPETAIRAYVNDEAISDEQLPTDVSDSLEYEFAQFRLSRNNWKEELETGKRWAETLRQHAPAIYREFLDILNRA